MIGTRARLGDTSKSGGGTGRVEGEGGQVKGEGRANGEGRSVKSMRVRGSSVVSEMAR